MSHILASVYLINFGAYLRGKIMDIAPVKNRVYKVLDKQAKAGNSNTQQSSQTQRSQKNKEKETIKNNEWMD